MPRKPKDDSPKFYRLLTVDGQDWAMQIEPISATKGKHCDNCGRETGVFFRDCGPEWLLDDTLTVKPAYPNIQCYPCWIDGEGPFVEIDKKGRMTMPVRYTVAFARDKVEVAKLAKIWKSGQKMMKEVRTPYGDVIVFAFPDEKPSGEDYSMKCPHCDKLISLTVSS